MLQVNRLLLMTVGKTHSGKSTFGQLLASRLGNACVIDQDNHAAFVNAHYRSLLPKQGPNELKYSVSATIIDYAIKRTDVHVILCNAYHSRSGRRKLLEKFQAHGFTTVLVHFDIPDEVLEARVAATTRSTAVLRSASSFAEVLARQGAETGRGDIIPPEAGEADFLFRLESSRDVQLIIERILDLA